MDFSHIPVLSEPIIDYINQYITNHKRQEITILDCTLGEGGHSDLFLTRFEHAKIIAFEQDEEILSVAKARLREFQDRIYFYHANFTALEDLSKDVHFPKANIILADLGISTFHYEISTRGLSFTKDELLDMRLRKELSVSAYDIVNGYSRDEIANIIYEFGEDIQSRRIADAIITERSVKAISTTLELATIISKAIPRRFHPPNIHVATRTFMALRIFINKELDNLKKALPMWVRQLKGSGLLFVISFHSLEDRIVKHFLKENAVHGKKNQADPEKVLKLLTKKPIIPSREEIERNLKSRSAKLRIAEKRMDEAL